jgi:hypothetical protein
MAKKGSVRADKSLFERLLGAMATGKPLEKPQAKARASAKAGDEERSKRYQ